MKTKILFVCHGNVGRSPTAEYVFKDLVYKNGLANQFEISSGGTSAGAVGIPFDPRAKAKVIEHGIQVKEHFARQMTAEDYDCYDMILCMDHINLDDLYQMTDDDPQHKISLLLDFTDRKGEDIADPWYTRDFDTAWREIYAGCEGLLETLTSGEGHGEDRRS